MKEYHKIQTMFKRDPETNFKTLLEGDFSLPEFEFLSKNLWEFTEKVDGTNIRIIWNGETLCFKGKTDNAQIPNFLLEALKAQIDIYRFPDVFPDGNACLYGEGYGAKIQKGGGNYRPDQGFVLFDVLVDTWWLKREAVADVADKLDITIVPSLGYGTLKDMVSMVKQGFESTWGPFKAEGLVARPSVDLFTRSGNRIITKLKTKDFR